ncbi:HD-GYP domain-containing protein [Sulfurimonas sp.]|uniref:HD-GYP domain-containing protein n=1 Tax=Sulfurimonas sp. TaxID=2022749 RepID=UPI0035690AFB
MEHKTVRQSGINTLSKAPRKEKEHAYILIDNDAMKLVPVDKRILNIGLKLDFKLFSIHEKTHMSLFLQAHSVIDEDKKQKLQHVEQVYTLESEKDKYNNFLESHIQDIVRDDTLTLDEKTDIIYEATTDLTKELYSNPDALKNSHLTENIVRPILETILYNEDTISSYMKIIEYDYYTHTHSLNVSVYSLCLGAELKLDKERLTALGKSALLHDIGKSEIDPNIVNKQGFLTDEEFETMKSHPGMGYEIALKYNINDKDILDGIKHHHEKVDGQGYPENLSNNSLGLFPRIICVCDVFDALTTRRSYKNAMHSFDALMLMKTHMSSHFDQSILNTFIRMLHD